MASLCDVKMVLRFRNEEDRASCAELLEEQDTYKAWVALNNATVKGLQFSVFKNPLLYVTGWCMWSVGCALLDGRYIDYNREAWPDLLSLQDVAKRYGAYIEVVGRSEENRLGEHYGISPDGTIELEEYFDFNSYPTCYYDTYEEFCEDYGNVLSEEDFDSEDYVCVGEPDTPFEDWILDEGRTLE